MLQKVTPRCFDDSLRSTAGSHRHSRCRTIYGPERVLYSFCPRIRACVQVRLRSFSFCPYAILTPVCYSLTQEASLREVESLRQQIYRVKGTTVPIVVVGTKSDLTAEREVHRTHIQQLSQTWGLPFYETSAKRNWHVDEVFEDLVRQMRAQYPEENKRRKKRRTIKDIGCIVS